MSTDTPRTDAEIEENKKLFGWAVCEAPFVRTLERELTAMTAERDALRAALEDSIQCMGCAEVALRAWGYLTSADKCVAALTQSRAALNHRKP